ncbi:cytochrome c biogenesis protein ResB [Actinomycetaceae bacterium WB03_NA08]|uniref:Cytochrome c biogenesis protein ResB n=1 Tax=Scrofimicrobium canadense TaxID=2652290 RepID=A0A6N7VT10_9ACTO|nr:cytochrome c biogenesis protein ResB [Scrofimicrobium canadense]MSS84080.1 cytochrome c biogenesis protein ResB [Scrofimicrobium canadense]
MSHSVVVDNEELQSEQQTSEVPGKEFFLWIYRFFYSKTVGLILILLFAVMAVIGALVIQAPPGTMKDPSAAASFLDQVRPSFGGWTSILAFLGFFNIFTSIPFYVVIGMLAASITACTVHRIPELWRRVHTPRLHVSPTFFTKARYRGEVHVEASQEEALAVAAQVLGTQHYRVLTDDRDPEHARYADRNARSGIGTVLAHASFIMILLAFVVSSTWGIEEDLSIPVGGSVEVGHNTKLSLEVTAFSDTYTEEGRPADYVSHVILTDDGEKVAEQDVRVNSPLVYDGLKFHQVTFGIAADVSVTDLDGNELFSQAVPLKWTSSDGANAIGKFTIPDSDIEVVVVTPASGRVDSDLAAGTAAFELYSLNSDERLGMVEATQGDAVQAGEYQLTFERERQFTGLRLRQDPGAPLMWAGSVLLVVGMTITFWFQYRRLWLRATPKPDGSTVVQFGAVARFDVSFERQFQAIVEEVGMRLAPQKEEEHG